MTDNHDPVEPVNTDEPTIRYLVQQSPNDFIIEVPTTWKLTFGPVNPGAQVNARDLHCIRVWDGQNAKTAHLRAVYCDCRGFRDLSIPLARKVSKETGSASWVKDSMGNFEASEKREVETELLEEKVPF